MDRVKRAGRAVGGAIMVLVGVAVVRNGGVIDIALGAVALLSGLGVLLRAGQARGAHDPWQHSPRR